MDDLHFPSRRKRGIGQKVAMLGVSKSSNAQAVEQRGFREASAWQPLPKLGSPIAMGYRRAPTCGLDRLSLDYVHTVLGSGTSQRHSSFNR
jgi:hypothetical protein